MTPLSKCLSFRLIGQRFCDKPYSHAEKVERFLFRVVYGGLLDKIPFGAAFGKGLTFKMGQTHMHSYLHPLLRRIEQGEIDPSFVISHRVGLEEAPAAYRTFRDKRDQCVKVVLDLWKTQPVAA